MAFKQATRWTGDLVSDLRQTKSPKFLIPRIRLGGFEQHIFQSINQSITYYARKQHSENYTKINIQTNMKN